MRPLAGMAPTVLAWVTPAWADHGVGLRSEGMSPITAALVWAAVAFLVGMAIIGIVTVVARLNRR